MKSLIIGAAILATFAGASGAMAQFAFTPIGPTVEISCNVVDVSAFADRVHVQCANPSAMSGFAGIKYYAVPTSSPMANLVVTLATSAKTAKKDLSITAITAESANPAGCGKGDCRKIEAIRLFY